MDPLGTVTAIEVLLQLLAAAVAPLNVTVLVPCVEPKFVPVMVTGVPAIPEDGDRPLMVGGGTTVKVCVPVVDTPLTVTTTLPVVAPLGTGATIEVALQLEGVAATPLKVTVLVPCVEPKFVPVIVTEVPTGPELGDSDVMLGGGGGVMTVKLVGTILNAARLSRQ